MSHVSTIEVEVKDLAALRDAAERCGCEFVEGQKTYRWYGRHVGDYPLPQGFAASDLGHCEHAIRVKGGNAQAYEVGVVKRRDGKPGYTLLWDFWAGGHGLQKAIGNNGQELTQNYAACAAIRAAKRLGYRVQEKKLATGEIQLVAQR